MNVTLYFKRLLILIGCAVPAVCQYKFDSWTTDNGLPQNSVWAMVQARDGYLWFTTSDGLVRFDGVRFRVFNSVNTTELTDNVFTPYCLLEDRDGGLWAGTHTGAVRYYNGAFVHYTAQDGLPGNTVLRIDQTAEGAIWIFTDRGLARWDASRLTPVSTPSSALAPPRSMGVDAPSSAYGGSPPAAGNVSLTASGHRFRSRPVCSTREHCVSIRLWKTPSAACGTPHSIALVNAIASSVAGSPSSRACRMDPSSATRTGRAIYG